MYISVGTYLAIKILGEGDIHLAEIGRRVKSGRSIYGFTTNLD